MTSIFNVAFIYLNCGEKYDDIHRSYANNYKVVVKLKPDKTSGLNGIRTHDLCVTGAVLYPYYVHTKRFAPA